MKKIYFILLFSFCVCFSELFAQGGSNYTIFGLGDVIPITSAAYTSLGETCIAMPSETAINTRNPALWSSLTSTRLQGGYRFSQHFLSTSTSTINQNNGKVDGMITIFNVDTVSGLSIGLGLVPYTLVNYWLDIPRVVTVDDITLNGVESHQGAGGLSQAFLGASVRPFEGLAIGGTIFASFGNITRTVNTVFYGTNTYPSSDIYKDMFSGFGFRGGIYFSAIKNLGIGAFFVTPQKLNIESQLSYLSPLLANDTTFTNNFDLKIRPSYGVGISYLSGKFLFGADISFQDYSNIDYWKADNMNFRNTKQFSVGISRIGNKSIYAPLEDKITYNTGFGYRELYYSIGSHDINEIYGSFGGQVPIIGNAMLDASITIGSRGTTSDGLIREVFTRLNIDISIGETWFKPFIREGGN